MAQQELKDLAISELQPGVNEASQRKVSGLVTLIWPYSSITKTISLLVVEPDFRLRTRRGQVRLVLKGASAKAITKAGIASGDLLSLRLKGVEWQKDESTNLTPGKGIEWQLQYGEYLDAEVRREPGEAIPIIVDHPASSADSPYSASSPTETSFFNSHIPTSIRGPRFAKLQNSEAWSSPAFLKRDHFASQAQNLEDEEEFPDNERRKKTRFGRGSRDWRFAERTPSPPKEILATSLDVETPSKQPTVDTHVLNEYQVEAERVGQENLVDSGPTASEPQPVPQVSSQFQEQKQTIEPVSAEGQWTAETGDETAPSMNGDASNITDLEQLRPFSRQDGFKKEPPEVSEEPLVEKHPDRRSPSVVSLSSSVSSSSSEDQFEEEHQAARRIVETTEVSTSAVTVLPTDTVVPMQIDTDHGNQTLDDPLDGPKSEQNVSKVESFQVPTSSLAESLSRSQNHDLTPENAFGLVESKVIEIEDVEPVDTTTHVQASRPSIEEPHPINARQEDAQMSTEGSDVETPGTSSIASDMSKIGKEDIQRSLEIPKEETVSKGMDKNAIEAYSAANDHHMAATDTTSPIKSLEAQVVAQSSVDVTSKSPTTHRADIGDVVETHPRQALEPDESLPAQLLEAQPPSVQAPARESSHSKSEHDDLLAVESQGNTFTTSGPNEPEPVVDDRQVGATTADMNDAAETMEESRGHLEAQSGRVDLNTGLQDGGDIHVVEPPSTIQDSAPLPVKDQLPTPSTTQKTSFVSHGSTLSLQTLPDEEETLPSPRLTQENGAPEQQRTPVLATQAEVLLDSTSLPQSQHIVEDIPKQSMSPPSITPTKKPNLIERLKAMRKASHSGHKSRLSGQSTASSPWFAPRGSTTAVPDSEAESVVSEADQRISRDEPVALPSRRKGSKPLMTPEKQLHDTFIRSSPAQSNVSSPASTQYAPQSQPVPGLRTSTSYYVPLSGLSSHFDTLSDILALAVSSTSPARATSGPKDWHQSIYLTDGSLLQNAKPESALNSSASSSRKPLTITAQILRPQRTSFPQIELADAILLRDFKVKFFQKRIALVSTPSSSWAVFRQGAEPQVKGPPIEFGAEERGFARLHWQWWRRLSDETRERIVGAVPPSSGQETTAGPSKVTRPEKANGREQSSTSSTGIKGKGRKQGIYGVGVDLPGSQTSPTSTPTNNKQKEIKNESKRESSTKSGDRYSTQALAKEWATGLIKSSEPEDQSGGDEDKIPKPNITRKALRPRDARGKAKSVSPEKEDPPIARKGRAAAARPRRGRKATSVATDESESEGANLRSKGRPKRGKSIEIEDSESEKEEPGGGGKRMHELRDGKQYRDRR